MRVYLVNPSHVSFGIAVITPRWLYVLAAATPAKLRRPDHLRRDARSRSTPASSRPATSSASASTPATRCAATRSAALARARGAYVVFGGIHATLYPDEAHELGGAHAVVTRRRRRRRGRRCIADCVAGTPAADLRRRPRSTATSFMPARWDLLPAGPLHVGVGADRARLPEALLVLLGVAHRRPGAAAARRSTPSSREIVELRRRGLPVHRARRRQLLPGHARRSRAGRAARTITTRLHELEALRAERFELMERLAKLPDDMVFFTQITMEAAEDPEFLDAMRAGAHPRRARRRRVGDARRAEGRLQGLQPRRRRARRAAADVPRRTASTCSGRSSSGCRAIAPTRSRRPPTLAERAGVTFAQFVMLTPFPGTVDFEKWEREVAPRPRGRSTACRSRGTG